MFTAKVYRQGIEGPRRTHLYEAVEVDVVPDEAGLKKGEVMVLLHKQNGDNVAITVSPEPATEPDHYPCNTVIIENSAGKTTEIISRTRRPSK